MKRLALLVLCVAMLASSGCYWWGRPQGGCGYGAGYGGGCPSGSCGAGGGYGATPYGAAPGYQQGAYMPYGAPITAAAPMDYIVQ